MTTTPKRLPTHTFLASLGKTVLRPGGKEATNRLLAACQLHKDTHILEVAPNMGTTAIHIAKTYGASVTGIDLNKEAVAKAQANVEAVEETEVCMIDGDQLKAFLEKTPAVLFKILEQLTIRIESVEDSLSAICHKEVGSRVASFLLKQMDVQKEPSFMLTVSKKDIASLLGTTRESVSRKLSEFQKQGYIEMNGNIIKVLHLSSLKEIASM